MTFQSNPLTKDLIGLKNENAIVRSVKNIVFTVPGEKFFNPRFGSRITQLLFENIDSITALSIQDEIESSIRQYEPRVDLKEVNVNARPDDNAFDVKIVYDIIGADIAPQQLELILQPTR